MRKLVFLLVIFSLPSTLWAADPIIGTWKLNLAESSISKELAAMAEQAPYKERTEVYREVNDGLIEFTVLGSRTDGSSISGKWTWPRQGGIAERQSPAPLPKEESCVQTLLEPGVWYITFLQNGIQDGVFHKVISKDGKIMRQILRVMDPKGKLIEEILVFNKQ